MVVHFPEYCNTYGSLFAYCLGIHRDVDQKDRQIEKIDRLNIQTVLLQTDRKINTRYIIKIDRKNKHIIDDLKIFIQLSLLIYNLVQARLAVHLTLGPTTKDN